MTLNDTEKRIMELTKTLIMHKVDKLEGHAFGHGYLWGYVTIRRAQKNGKVKVFRMKTCFGGVCVARPTEAIRLASEVPDVSGVWLNWD